MSENFAARLKPAKWATKNDIADFVKNIDFDKKLASINKKVTSNKTRHVEVDKKLNNLSGKVKLISIKGITKDLINGCSIFNAAKYFIEDGPQNYLVFQPLIRYFKLITNIAVMRRKCKSLSDESIKPTATSNNSLNLRLDSYNYLKCQVVLNKNFVENW